MRGRNLNWDETRTRMKTVVFTASLVFALHLSVMAQQPASVSDKVTGILVRMESADRPTRKAAFGELLGVISEANNASQIPDNHATLKNFIARNPEQAEAVRLALIRMLTLENAAVHSPRTSSTTITKENREAGFRSENDVYPALIQEVAELKDERAIPALVGAVTTGGMAMRAVAEFGQKALGPVLDLLNDASPLVRLSALHTIRHMLGNGSLNDLPSQLRTKAALRESLKDKESVVRRSAIYAIEYLDDRQEFLPILRDLAETDPGKRPGQAGEGGEFYPVRVQAKELIRKIENHVPPVIDKGIEHRPARAESTKP